MSNMKVLKSNFMQSYHKGKENKEVKTNILCFWRWRARDSNACDSLSDLQALRMGCCGGLKEKPTRWIPVSGVFREISKAIS